MSDNFTVGTHGERIADSQPRGRIFGRTTASVAAQDPPLRPHLFSGPQQFDLGYGSVYRHPPSTAPDPVGATHFTVGTHGAHVADLHSGARVWKYPHQQVFAPEQHYLGSFFRIEQDSTEQPFARHWRVAVLPSVEPTPPPQRPALFASPQQTNLEPHARTFRVAVLPSALQTPNRQIFGAPQQADLQPFARTFRVTTLPAADVPDAAFLYARGQLEQQMPSFVCGTQPRNEDISPVPGTLLCRAYRRGYFGGRVVEPGDSVTITAPQQYSPYWMEVVGALPTNWDTVMRRYVSAVDRATLRPVTRSEVDEWIDTEREPPEEPPSGVFD